MAFFRDVWKTLKRSGQQFNQHQLTDRAAALTYYGVLSIFPALIVLVSMLGLLSKEASSRLLYLINKTAPDTIGATITSGIGELQESPGAASVLAIAGTIGAIWSASGYISAFMRATNVICEVGEGRPLWKTLTTRLVLTIIVGLLAIASALTLVFTGEFANFLGKFFGLAETFVDIWQIIRWPILVFIISIIFAILYWAAPNAKTGKFNPVSRGGIVAVLLWLAVSGLFAIYLANWNSYNKTYGALGSVIAMLVWLWISNTIVLYGAVLNAEAARDRFGGPLKPRDTTKLAQTETT